LTAEANGIVERFHRIVLYEFYRVAFRRKIKHEQLQADLDLWLKEYNEVRPHQSLEYITLEGRLRCSTDSKID
jgi:transposase InsO family protein